MSATFWRHAESTSTVEMRRLWIMSLVITYGASINTSSTNYDTISLPAERCDGTDLAPEHTQHALLLVEDGQVHVVELVGERVVVDSHDDIVSKATQS